MWTTDGTPGLFSPPPTYSFDFCRSKIINILTQGHQKQTSKQKQYLLEHYNVLNLNCGWSIASHFRNHDISDEGHGQCQHFKAIGRKQSLQRLADSVLWGRRSNTQQQTWDTPAVQSHRKAHVLQDVCTVLNQNDRRGDQTGHPRATAFRSIMFPETGLSRKEHDKEGVGVE